MGIPQLSFPGLDRWDLETTRSVSDIAALFAVPLVVRWSVKWLKTEEFGEDFSQYVVLRNRWKFWSENINPFEMIIVVYPE